MLAIAPDLEPVSSTWLILAAKFVWKPVCLVTSDVS